MTRPHGGQVPLAKSSAQTWLPYWRMVRPGHLSITAVGCALGLANAVACGCGFDGARALVTVTLALLAHAGANALRTAYETVNTANAAHCLAPQSPVGAEPSCQVSADDAKHWGWVLFGVSALGGIWLALQSGAGLLPVGMAGLLLAWALFVPPFALMSRGLGEVTVALMSWLVVMGADYSQRGHFFIIPAYVGVSFAVLTACISWLRGLPVEQTVRPVDTQTLDTRLAAKVAHIHLLLMLGAHGWVVAGVWLLIPPTTALWALVSLPTGVMASWWLFRHGHPSTVSRTRQATLLTTITAHLHGAALSIAMLLPHL